MADAPVVRFHYLKSNAYRVVHADGVVGGPTPSGLVHVSFFSERLPIPTVVDYAVSDIGGGRGTLGNEIAREGKKGVVREVEVGVVMTLDMAKLLRAWLDDNIKRLETALRSGDDAGGPDAASRSWPSQRYCFRGFRGSDNHPLARIRSLRHRAKWRPPTVGAERN